MGKKRASAPKHGEYEHRGERWRVERPDAVVQEFLLDLSDLPKELSRWHAVWEEQAGLGERQSRAWLVLRRYFGVAPVMTSDPAELDGAWDVARIATECALLQVEVEDSVRQSVEWWERREDEMQNVLPVTRREEPAHEPAEDLPAPGAPAPARPAVLGESEKYELVKLAGLEENPPEHWDTIAKAVMTYRAYFEQPEASFFARDIIKMELMIEELDRKITDKLGHKDYATLVRTRSDLRSQIEATHDKLQGLVISRTGKKKDFADCIGQLVAAVQEYYKDGSKELVDGIFTAADIAVLIRPTTLRPSQYRPELPLMLREMTLNIFDPTAEMPKLSQESVRLVRKAFARALEDAGIEPVNQEGVSVGMGEDGDDLEEEASGSLPSSVQITLTGAAAASASMSPPAPRALPAGRTAEHDSVF